MQSTLALLTFFVGFLSSGSAFVVAPRSRHASTRSGVTVVRAGGENENNNNNGLSLPKLPLGSIILGVIGLSCLQDLTVEIPTLGTERGDPFGTIFDAAFLGYAVSSILTQTGVMRKDRASQGADLAGLECGVALSVGREPGTWMDKDWAASGARLSLPLTLRFTDEELDLGIPGEEALGGRFCRRVVVESGGGSYVGAQGTVQVPVKSGGWASFPTGAARGESKVRFFLDVEQEAKRNDVVLPATRIFFSSVCFDGERPASDSDCMEARIPAGDILETPTGVRMARSGGLTIKRENNIMNLYGAMGDVNLILGRYALSEKKL
jgi:hypothetical protein